MGRERTVFSGQGLIACPAPGSHSRKKSEVTSEIPVWAPSAGITGLAYRDATGKLAWGDLERSGRARQAWPRLQRTFLSKAVGPHVETICRNWARWEADPALLGGYPTRVAAGTDQSIQLVDLGQLYATN